MTLNLADEPVSQSALPQVSVIVPIYNGEVDLPDLLDCLRHQTYPAECVEYLLIDNGSSDRTPSILHALDQTAETVHFRPLPETNIQSSYAARNTGVKAAQGDILAFTDADCRPQPDWLEHLIVPFAESTVGIVAGEILALPGDTLLERYADRHAILSQKHTLAHLFCPYGQTANLAVRRQALEDLGMFRPYLTTGGDADLCWRILRQSSWQIQFREQAIIRHRHRATLADLRSQWQRYGRSNRYLHELHNVSLGKEMTRQDYFHRWSRWLLKEIPIAVTTRITNRKTHIANSSNLFDTLADTPLDLLCSQARDRGQRQAKLPDAAREIAWLLEPPLEKASLKDPLRSDLIANLSTIHSTANSLD